MGTISKFGVQHNRQVFKRDLHISMITLAYPLHFNGPLINTMSCFALVTGLRIVHLKISEPRNVEYNEVFFTDL